MTNPTPSAIDFMGRPLFRIGYGMGRASHTADSPENYDRSVRAIRHAFEGGVRYFDTAEFYENGRANRLLREAVDGQRDQVVYATKVGAKPTNGPVPMAAAQRPDELREAVEANLRSLGTDYLDIAYMRRMDFRPGIVIDDPAQQIPLADQLAELIALRDEGKIRGIGLSHVTLDQVRESIRAGVVVISNIYSLLVRGDEDMMSVATEQGIAWAPYFPLGGGAAFAPLPKAVDNPAVQQVAGETGASAQQVAAAWLLQHAPTAVLISGSVALQHIDENIAAASVQLSTEQMTLLDAQAGQA